MNLKTWHGLTGPDKNGQVKMRNNNAQETHSIPIQTI